MEGTTFGNPLIDERILPLYLVIPCFPVKVFSAKSPSARIAFG